MCHYENEFCKHLCSCTANKKLKFICKAEEICNCVLIKYIWRSFDKNTRDASGINKNTRTLASIDLHS